MPDLQAADHLLGSMLALRGGYQGKERAWGSEGAIGASTQTLLRESLRTYAASWGRPRYRIHPLEPPQAHLYGW